MTFLPVEITEPNSKRQGMMIVIMSEEEPGLPDSPLVYCPQCGDLLSHAGTLEFCPDEAACGWTRRLQK